MTLGDVGQGLGDVGGEELALIVHDVFDQFGFDLGGSLGFEAGVVYAAQADGVEVFILAVGG